MSAQFNHHTTTIRALHDCYSVCLETFSLHCAEQGEEHLESQQVRVMLSCIELCKLTASFLLRHSAYAEDLCDLCADVCLECAEHCEEINDEAMSRCARACEKAADACMDKRSYLQSLAA